MLRYLRQVLLTMPGNFMYGLLHPKAALTPLQETHLIHAVELALAQYDQVYYVCLATEVRHYRPLSTT